MWGVAQTVRFALLLSAAAFAAGAAAGCECVPFYLCKSGQGVSHLRGSEVCNNSLTLHVCCEVLRSGKSEERDQVGDLARFVQHTKPDDGSSSNFIEVPRSPEGLRGCGLKGIDPVNRKFSKRDLKCREPTFYGEFPWMVALLNMETKTFICGGTLIEPGVVITAAHCLYDPETGNKIDNIVVTAGDWNRRNDYEPIIHQERKVLKMIIHEYFKRGNFQNDISLLILEKDFILNEVVNTVCITEQMLKPVRCQASGWGFNNNVENGTFDIMTKVRLPLVDFHECQNKLRSTRLGSRFNLYPGVICAGGLLNVDTCKGDGGGPLVCSGIEGEPFRYSLVGIISWGIGCGTGVPGVYASIQYYYQWITEHIKLNYSLPPKELFELTAKINFRK